MLRIILIISAIFLTPSLVRAQEGESYENMICRFDFKLGSYLTNEPDAFHYSNDSSSCLVRKMPNGDRIASFTVSTKEGSSQTAESIPITVIITEKIRDTSSFYIILTIGQHGVWHGIHHIEEKRYMRSMYGKLVEDAITPDGPFTSIFWRQNSASLRPIPDSSSSKSEYFIQERSFLIIEPAGTERIEQQQEAEF